MALSLRDVVIAEVTEQLYRAVRVSVQALRSSLKLPRRRDVRVV
jgi:hypothetical protein